MQVHFRPVVQFGNKAEKLTNRLFETDNLPFGDVRKVLESNGYEETHHNSSHHVFKNDDGDSLTIADRGNRPVSKDALRDVRNRIKP